MPAEDDYSRRQILQHSTPVSPSPAIRPQYHTSNCVSAYSPDRYPNNVHCDRYAAGYAPDRNQSERYSGDRNQPDRFAAERNQPDRFGPGRNQSDLFGADAGRSERFGSERSQSDRLPSGERYQGVSERYPLGERPQTSISSDRLVANQVAQAYQADNRFITYHRYPERFAPAGSLERPHANNDRYSRTVTPTSTDRYNTLSTDKGRKTPERYLDRYHTISHEKDRCKPERYAQTEQFNMHGDKDRKGSGDRYILQGDVIVDRQTSTSEVCYGNDHHKGDKRERSGSGDRKSRHQYQHDQFLPDTYQSDRYPPIPCPERFATENGYSESNYLEPPSPAPASDRFIPPPPLSPGSTPTTPNCFTNSHFPPSTTVPDKFIPPPPLTTTDTMETFPSGKNEKSYQYPHHDRFNQQQQQQHRYGEVQYGADRYKVSSEGYHGPSDKYVSNERYEMGRYGPQNPHMPVERYVPQQQPEDYYGFQYDRYSVKINANDPYMRRDLSNLQYRIPFQNQYQKVRYIGTPSRTKCCQYSEGYHLSKSSPGSSSSSSVASQNKEHHPKEGAVAVAPPCVNNVNVSLQDIQCQNFKQSNYPQEKVSQCVGVCSSSKECLAFVSPNLRVASRGQCRHSICVNPSVEYVASNGTRRVCATPPPRGTICSQDCTKYNETCCARARGQTSFTVAIWRSSPAQMNQGQPQQPQAQPQQEQSAAAAASSSSSSNVNQAADNDQTAEASIASNDSKTTVQTTPQPPIVRTTAQLPVHSRAVSMPASSTADVDRIQRPPKNRGGVNYSQSERIPNRPTLERSVSKKEMIKNYIKKETATFFGVGEDNEAEQHNLWLDRRKRMASRAYGPLKEEYRASTLRAHRRTVSELPTRTTATSGQLIAERPDVLPGPSDVPDGDEVSRNVTLRRKESVARMTWDGLSYVVTTLTRQRPRPRSQNNQWSRSFPADVPAQEPAGEDDTFFEPAESAVLPRLSDGAADTVDGRGSGDIAERMHSQERYTAQRVSSGWRRDVPRGSSRQLAKVGKSKISNCLDNLLDNSDRRQYGMGWVGRMFGRTFKKSVVYDETIQDQLDDLEDHRPMFTYWVTIVQILVLFISLVCYGFGPFGIDLQSRSGQVLVTSLSLQQVDYLEPATFWFGPRAADLIHLGAKFAPCMRVDAEISQEIEKIRTIERETACCIRNDDSGCVQSSKADCSETISTWKKWSDKNYGPGGRISGSVCGLDPKFCDAPASVHPYEWPDDITKWPICRKTNASKQNRTRMDTTGRDKHLEHMVCEIIGHPCCIGIHGQCKITTKEYCDFVRGNFHEEASLCSQVSCLNDVCGMLPFYFPETPDQFYRLWTSIFLHAGVLQLALTVVIQYFLMRDLEKLTGSLRICLIYMGSGVAGNLASAIFVPYRADVGPAGSQFGLLACLIVEVINVWPMLKHPRRALGKLLGITFVLFLVGLLPWVDNYAHLFGFAFGFLLSYALLPFISFGSYERQKKIILIWVCLLSGGILFIFLVILFYITPVYNCKICSYFNCLPLTRDFCASQNINFKREEPIV
ncbi:inactive rhomboid protein 1 isoform X2 [Harmonia axyridis]|uniref:inactive rhomboid protein 1 isoform X2 n=1 Tax=Harmonia axyridis TaxID=115357 RepID=UPI001E275F3A|nr:inactive rhomboid protein 1 isoform X2 [Harmonia axyridis]